MKRWISLVFLSMLLLFAALLPAQACAAAQPSAVAQIETLRLQNGRFDVGDAFRQYGLKTVEAANARIETIIAQSCRMAERAECDAEVRAIILSMLTRTHTVSYTARAAAAVCGVKTVCEYVAVEIGGYTVTVSYTHLICSHSVLYFQTDSLHFLMNGSMPYSSICGLPSRPSIFSTSSSTGRPWVSQPALRSTS